MNKSKLKQKGVSSTIKPYKKCTTNNKTLSFQDLCKEITKQQIEVLKLGKFVFKNLIAVKLNIVVQNIFLNIFKPYLINNIFKIIHISVNFIIYKIFLM